MNRAERRSGGWDKFTPQGDYDHFVSETDENTQKVLMLLLREPLGGMEGDMDDRRLYEAIRELIGAGCLDLYFRFGHGGVEISPELKIPGIGTFENYQSRAQH